MSNFNALKVVNIHTPCRSWGPPFLQPDEASGGVRESAYFLSVNRNKKSVCINMKRKEGQALIRWVNQRWMGQIHYNDNMIL